MSEYIRLSNKLHLRLHRDRGEYIFWCPGCEEPHGFIVRSDPRTYPSWTFNGSVLHPTFTPSLLHPRERRCHLFLIEGVIDYCSDCHHKFAGSKTHMRPYFD